MWCHERGKYTHTHAKTVTRIIASRILNNLQAYSVLDGSALITPFHPNNRRRAGGAKLTKLLRSRTATAQPRPLEVKLEVPARKTDPGGQGAGSPTFGEQQKYFGCAAASGYGLPAHPESSPERTEEQESPPLVLCTDLNHNPNEESHTRSS